MDNQTITIPIEAYVTALKSSFELGHNFVEVKVGQSSGWDILEPIIRRGIETFITSNTPPAPETPIRFRRPIYQAVVGDKRALSDIKQELKDLAPEEHRNADMLRAVTGMREEEIVKYSQDTLKRMVFELEVLIIYRQRNQLP